MMELWSSPDGASGDAFPRPRRPNPDLSAISEKSESSPKTPNTTMDTPSLARIDSIESPESDSGGGQGINPQDATVPTLATPISTPVPSPTSTHKAGAPIASNETKSKPRNRHDKKKQKKQKKPKQARRRKRGRTVRLATVDERRSNEQPSIPLPVNQYETILRRRAIRSNADRQESHLHQQQNNQQRVDDDGNEEEYGDISLGMKLNILGGKVIVQRLNSLSDGRASPAQLVGVIRRGDVLISINNTTLVNLPLDQLVSGLEPLSTPDKSGRYQELLRLRFAEGEGLKLLDAEEQNTVQISSFDAQNGGVDGANELFSMFPPMVDQLSGQPFFEFDNQSFQKRNELQEKQDQNREIADQTASSLPVQQNSSLDEEKQPDVIQDNKDHHLSQALARRRLAERERFVSEFFTWSENCAQLLRPEVVAAMPEKPSTETLLTRSEMLEIGRRAILGAVSLGFKIEELDRGSLDVRCFRRWNSSLSLRSGAVSRRRYVMEVASLPAHFDKNVNRDDEADDSSTNSGTGTGAGSMGSEDFDGDELILRLAAHDEIWRKQVLEVLRKSITALHDENACQTDTTPVDEGIDSATDGFGNFLFGEEVTKIVNEKKKSRALPPEEITHVLFDISTQLALTMPENVTMSGNATIVGGGSIVSIRSSLLPMTEKFSANNTRDSFLAAYFVLNEALPLWLKTFLPLKWEHRRVLWPFVKPSGEDVNSNTWDDNLTVDSFTTSSLVGLDFGKRNKNLQEIIEEQELDVETRSETCFLISYYFERCLVPKLVKNRGRSHYREELVDFVKQYGCYLKMDTCLAHAAMMGCDDAISVLLEVADYDPRHLEGMKQITRANSLVIYDPSILSALVKCLFNIRKDPSADHRLTVIHACVSAYPDIRPWQVRKECLLETSDSIIRCSKEELRELYYVYLSLLLHHTDGHEKARRDAALIEEWCVLSLQQQSKKEGSSRRKNFYIVASPYSNNHLCYHRDLIMLIKLSMTSGEFDIALDLALEIIDNTELARSEEVRTLIVKSVRTVAHKTLDEDWSKEKDATLRTLKKIVTLFGKVASKSVFQSRQAISVGEEMHSLLLYKINGAAGAAFTDAQILELVEFFVKEAMPSDILQTLNKWTADHELRSNNLVSLLQTALQRGAHIAMKSELSGSLFHLKRARQNVSDISSDHSSMNSMDERTIANRTIWGNMSNGLLKIEK